MHRRDDLKTWLTEVGSLYGAVILFISLSFLIPVLDSFLAAGDSAPRVAETETMPAGVYGDYPR